MSSSFSVTFRALDGIALVRGLTAASADAIVRDWSSCGARRLCEDEAEAIAAAENQNEESGAPLVEVIDREAISHVNDRTFFESVVNQATNLAIRSRRGSRLLFHGAALAHPSLGTAIALVAESGTGKTTATRHLGRELAYLTDETVSISLEPGDDYRVEPFAKPLSTLEGGVRPKVQHSPESLGLMPASLALDTRLVAVAVLDRIRDEVDEIGPKAPEHNPDRPSGVSRLQLVDAIAELVGQTSSLTAVPRGLVAFATMLDECGGAVR